jgi:peptide deformylase
MTVREIVKIGQPVLRQKAKKIRRVDLSTKRLVQDLIDTIHEANGSGLAAPQINVPLRAIITKVNDQIHVVLNPEIVKESDEEIEADEGCLSIPGWYGPVKRKEQVTVRGLSRTGKPLKIRSEGWEARAFQHEVDHLDGVLFIDRMDDPSKLHKVQSQEEEEELEEEQAIV